MLEKNMKTSQCKENDRVCDTHNKLYKLVETKKNFCTHSLSLPKEYFLTIFLINIYVATIKK